MGGPMRYQRMRSRNGLMFRVPDDAPGPYSWETLPQSQRDHFDPSATPRANMHTLAGDLNRMERDYLGDNYNAGTEHDGKADLGRGVAEATGVDLEAVRKVLRFVFFEQP